MTVQPDPPSLTPEARRALINIGLLDAFLIGVALVVYLNTHDILHLVLGAFGAGAITVPMLFRWADKHGKGGKG